MSDFGIKMDLIQSTFSLPSVMEQLHIKKDGCQQYTVCVCGPIYFQVVLITVGVEIAEWISLHFVFAVKFSTL